MWNSCKTNRLYATLEEMGTYYTKGIIKEPIGFTHSMSYDEYEASRVDNTFKIGIMSMKKQEQMK